MESRKRNVRFDKWIHDEIETMAEEKGQTFTDIVNFLLEDELNHIGFTRASYEARRLGIGRAKPESDQERHAQ